MWPSDRQDASRWRSADAASTTARASDTEHALFTGIHRFLEHHHGATEYIRHRFGLMADARRGRHLRALMHYEVARSGVPIAGAEALDAGCGPGIYAVALAARGARRVLAMDRFPENVATLAEIARRFALPIEAIEGDAAAIPGPAERFDLVYCREAISHFADWEGFLRECVRVLRPGGAAVVSDGNNGANPLVRARIARMWLRSERGPFDPVSFPDGGPLPYLFRRWMIIRRELPDLSEEQTFRLGLSTTTLGGDALREAMRRYAERGELPEKTYRAGMSVRRPEDGQRNEEALDPLDIARRWRALGLDARVHPHFGFGRGAPVRALNALAERLPSLAATLAPAYVITARRPG
jgi:2-polyprenyl-3-methyl-5-hydroxy-6-metoxy-1,4-benzoquinol methylase